MTHDELLAKVNTTALVTARLFGWVGNRKESNALRAVIELHKPDRYSPEYCDVCWWEEHEREDYPCQTIQAIEKELE